VSNFGTTGTEIPDGQLLLKYMKAWGAIWITMKGEEGKWKQLKEIEGRCKK